MLEFLVMLPNLEHNSFYFYYIGNWVKNCTLQSWNVGNALIFQLGKWPAMTACTLLGMQLFEMPC